MGFVNASRLTAVAVAVGVVISAAACAPASDSASNSDSRNKATTQQSPFPTSARAATSYSVVQVDKLSPSEQVTVSALQGLLARSSTSQIFTLVGANDSHDVGGGAMWLKLSGVANTPCGCEASPQAFWSWVSSMWPNSGSSAKQYVLYNLSANAASVNSANSLAGICTSLPVDVSDQANAAAAGFTSKVDASNLTTQALITTYGQASNPCGNKLATNVAVELDPRSVYAGGPRDYATMNNALVFFDVKGGAVPNLTSALGYVQAPSPIMGWGDPDTNGELSYVSPTGAAGDFYIAGDWARNLSVLSGLASVTPPKPAPTPAAAAAPAPQSPSPSPAASGKAAGTPPRSATFLMSDGDNLQWLLNRGNSPNWWGSSVRGTVQIGWSMSPSLYYLAPTAWNYYVDTVTAADNFYTGPSGIGYTFGNVTNNSQAFNSQLADVNSFAGAANMPDVALFGDNDWDNTAYLGGALGQSSVAGGFYFEYAGWITPMSNQSTKTFSGKPMIPANEYLDSNTTQTVINDLCSSTSKNNGIYAIYVNAWGNNNSPMSLIQGVQSGVAKTCPASVNFVAPQQLVRAAASSSTGQLKAPNPKLGPSSKPHPSSSQHAK